MRRPTSKRIKTLKRLTNGTPNQNRVGERKDPGKPREVDEEIAFDPAPIVQYSGFIPHTACPWSIE